MDFRTTGALSSFSGYTQSVAGSITGPITGLSDFYTTPNGSSFVSSGYYQMATGASGLFNISSQTFSNVYSFLFYNDLINFSFVQSSSLYGTNGSDFFKYPGASTNSAVQYSLPKPYQSAQTLGTSGASGGISGTFMISWAFERYDGFIGPITTVDYTGLLGLVGHGVSAVTVRTPVLANNIIGATASNGVTYSSFGISYLRVWYELNGMGPFLGATPIPIAATSYSITDQFIGFTSLDFNEIQGSFLYGPGGGASGGGVVITVGGLAGQNPKTIEQFQNTLFLSGFASTPDTVWYSRPGEFEALDIDAFFDFRSNDGDIVTCLKAYFTQLVIFKVNSIGVITGNVADDTFTLSEVTTQYGNLSNNSACVWNQKMWFLDKSGVCEYNGANTRIVSDRVEDYFLRMNVQAARFTASMIHVKEHNEVWCAIPIDGAEKNNIIIVYDYLADAWTTKPISQLTYLANMTQGVDKQVTRYGDYSGMVYSFGQSLVLNNGVAPTCVIKTGFIHNMGHSVEKMFRRLYLDAAIPAGSTQTIAVNFYQNQGVSPVLQTTMVISDYQKRIDYGISAADMAIEFIYSEGTFLKLNGYTVEYRFQRSVTVT